MTTTQQPHIVHEAIDERQHVRTRVPAKALLIGNTDVIECQIQDISLGGLGLVSEQPLHEGQLFKAQVTLDIHNASLNLEVDVKVVKQRGEVTGVAFIDLTPGKRDILRYVISAYLAGDIVDINGVLTVMQRENYIKQRKTKADNSRDWAGRLKAVLGTLVYLLVGLGILSALGYKLYLYLFRVEAVQAHVDTNAYHLNMPDNGFARFLLPPDQLSVSPGTPVAAVSGQLASRQELPEQLPALARLSAEERALLLGEQPLETVITSPCDCDVYYPQAATDRYAYRGDSLVHLLPKDQPLTVKAQIPYRVIDQINTIDQVSLQVYGVDGPLTGDIVGTRLLPQQGTIELTIQPDTSLPRSSYLSPVTVDLYRGLPFGL
ncbi:MAG: PilZ domain-containing protein [Pseudomonadales bacterium]|nr:PilZ domain-containing protein [Pseudomonadales bacterium]